RIEKTIEIDPIAAGMRSPVVELIERPHCPAVERERRDVARHADRSLLPTLRLSNRAMKSGLVSVRVLATLKDAASKRAAAAQAIDPRDRIGPVVRFLELHHRLGEVARPQDLAADEMALYPEHSEGCGENDPGEPHAAARRGEEFRIHLSRGANNVAVGEHEF